MCGIAGYSSIGTDSKVNPALIGPMIAALHHRGPDENGHAVFDQLAMANARLSIIGLSTGRQPISNDSGTTVVVYNGEIYNYPELRRELEGKGYVFKTNTDTEVLVHLYDEEGEKFVSRLNGMFAFSLYDKKRNRLMIARDRFGVKPLVYSYKDGILSYASEIKALRVLPWFSADPDPEGLAVFMGLFFIPDPWTAFKHVKKLRPGHYLMLSARGLEEHEYYDFDFSKQTPISSTDAAKETARLFEQSIGRQLLSDVPVGVLLSGGLDSRSVLAASCRRNPATTSFTITFSESSYNEGDQAAYWAKVYGSDHRKMLFQEQGFCNQYIARQKHLDEPYALWCNVATAALAKFIRDQGYKVVLSGEGGDELFLGYPTIHAANVAQYYMWLPAPLRKAIRLGATHLPAGTSRLPLSFKIKSFVEAEDPDIIRFFFGFKEVLRYSTWPALLTPEALKFLGHIDPALAFDQYRKKVSNWRLIDKLSYIDSKVFLPGCSFVGNDNAYMSASVESRVPFLDNDLVDFVCSMPTGVRFHPWKLKIILREALQKYFPQPAAIGNPPPYQKNGFEVPGNIWFKRPGFSALVSEVLSPARIKRTGFFQPQAVQTILSQQLSGKQNNERLIQAIMSLVLFLEGTYCER